MIRVHSWHSNLDLCETMTAVPRDNLDTVSVLTSVKPNISEAGTIPPNLLTSFRALVDKKCACQDPVMRPSSFLPFIHTCADSDLIDSALPCGGKNFKLCYMIGDESEENGSYSLKENRKNPTSALLGTDAVRASFQRQYVENG